jgi:hypothetical protein
MPYPTTWDPFFASYMTLADIYHYPTRHFRFDQAPAHTHPAKLTHETPGAADGAAARRV